ncbi:hypothetical protein FN846DRAFT_982638 [Sphaerosporella brunnea]|uniref:Uncharacterized protein n=1 Tax=Sphaerosporella brunnea TaxID=1250544 RepID=A0A5J5EBP7_9PEZI|nr:hypothetical protein FN846DRAFT_982638 [Sphaerosporella brunnea]
MALGAFLRRVITFGLFFLNRKKLRLFALVIISMVGKDARSLMLATAGNRCASIPRRRSVFNSRPGWLFNKAGL